MESDLGEVRQDINKVLQMINDKAEWLLQSVTISTAEWRTHARSNSETKESYSSTLNKFCKSDLSQIKVFTGAFFCWVPSAHSFRVSLLLTIELRANSVNRFGTDIVLTSLLCLRYLLPLLPLCRCKTLDLVATPRRICAAAVKKFGEDSPDRCAELGLEGASEHFHIHQKWRHVTSMCVYIY